MRKTTSSKKVVNRAFSNNEVVRFLNSFDVFYFYHVAEQRDLQQIEIGDFVKVKQCLDEAVIKAVRQILFRPFRLLIVNRCGIVMKGL